MFRPSSLASVLLLVLACSSKPEPANEDEAPRSASRPDGADRGAVHDQPSDRGAVEGTLLRAAGVVLSLPEAWTTTESSPRHAVAQHGEHRCVVVGARVGIALPTEGPAPAPTADGLGLRIELPSDRTLLLRRLGSALIACRLHRADAELHAALERALGEAHTTPEPTPEDPAPPGLVDVCLTADHEGRHRHVYVLGREGRVWSGALEAEALVQTPGLPEIRQIRCGRTALARTHDGRVLAADQDGPVLAPAHMPDELVALSSYDGREPRVLHLQQDAALLAATQGPAGSRGPAVTHFLRDGDGAWTFDAGDSLPAAGERHRGLPGTGEGGLVGARLAVTSHVPGRGCALTEDGWLWCWTEDGRPGRFPAVRWNPEDGVRGWSGARDLGFPPARIAQLVDAASDAIDLFAPPGGARICVRTETELRCIGPDDEVVRSPSCTTVPCACWFEARYGEQCEDEPIDPVALFRGSGTWLHDVRDYDGPCVLRGTDQLWCRPEPGTPHRRVELRSPSSRPNGS